MGRPRGEVDTSEYSGRLAESIKQRRERAGLSQEQLAEEMGVSSGTIYHWENGNASPKWNQVPALAAALGVKVHTLLPAE